LRYNDYSLENERKRNGAIALVKKLQTQKAPISALGSQTHANLSQPSAEVLGSALAAFAELRLSISITELDVNVSRRGYPRMSIAIDLGKS
jgi:endo-1,4-beta-xylanase